MRLSSVASNMVGSLSISCKNVLQLYNTTKNASLNSHQQDLVRCAMDSSSASVTPPPSFVSACDPPPQLELFGTLQSSYTQRVQLALQIKGLFHEYNYSEVDPADKRPVVLQFNPVYKKVPILFHHGRPLVESTVILQYIDETWKENPLMPADPYERAILRFWCHYNDDMIDPAVAEVFRSSKGEKREAAAEQVRERLKVMESELQNGYFKGRKFFGGDRIGLLDIVVGCGAYWFGMFEDVAGVKLVDSETFPRFSRWLKDFKEVDEVKEIILPVDELVMYFVSRNLSMAMVIRETLLGPEAADDDEREMLRERSTLFGDNEDEDDESEMLPEAAAFADDE